MERILLKSGGKDLSLPSGDPAVFIDLCVEELLELVEKNHDIKTPFFSRKKNMILHNIRIFVIPMKKESSKYKYYLEVAQNNFKKDE